MSPYRHFGLSPPATASSSQLLALEGIILLRLPLARALGGRLLVAVGGEKGDSVSASLPSRKGGGIGSMLLRRVLKDERARLEGGRSMARELFARVYGVEVERD